MRLKQNINTNTKNNQKKIKKKINQKYLHLLFLNQCRINWRGLTDLVQDLNYLMGFTSHSLHS